MKLKRLLSIILMLPIIITLFFNNVLAATTSSKYFTQDQINQILSYGFPNSYISRIDNYYDAFLEKEDIIENYIGRNLTASDRYNYFLDFCSSTKIITSDQGTNQSVRSQLTRALYFEVSNLCVNNPTGSIEGVKGVLDLITNRANSNSSDFPFNDYLSVAYYKCLDGFNVAKPDTYWHNIMINPIKDSAWHTNARVTLISTYMLSYCMENEIYDKESPQYYHRFSNLGTNYYYFNESSGTGRVNIGVFWFREEF